MRGNEWIFPGVWERALFSQHTMRTHCSFGNRLQAQLPVIMHPQIPCQCVQGVDLVEHFFHCLVGFTHS